MDEITRQLLNDKKFVRAMRNLCPDGKRLTSVTISCPQTKQSVTLTPETRKAVNAHLKKLVNS